MTLTQMYDATVAKLAAENGDYTCGHFQIDGIGKVKLSISPVDRSNSSLSRHYRKTWELNGKRISAEKLAAIVGM
jgi:hypothetical protein